MGSSWILSVIDITELQIFKSDINLISSFHIDTFATNDRGTRKTNKAVEFYPINSSNTWLRIPLLWKKITS